MISLSKNRRQLTIYSCLVVLLGVLFFFRYSQENAGYPSFRWDYGSHLVIVNSIKQLNLFPEWGATGPTPHVVAHWLPIYHGLIGAHVLAIVLNLIFGISLPKAMLILTDFSFLIYLGVLVQWMRKEKERKQFLLRAHPRRPQQKEVCGWALSAGLFLLFSLPAFVFVITEGFFSQAVSVGPYSLALYFLFRRKNLAAGIFILLGGWCYPDALMWLMPVWTYEYIGAKSVRDLTHSLFGAAFGILVPTLLVAVQVQRLLLSGTIQAVFSPLIPFAFLVVNLLLKKEGKAQVPFRSILLIYIGLVVFVCSISILVAHDLEYYALKNLFWAALFIPLIVLAQSITLKECVALCFIALVSLSIPTLNRWQKWNSVTQFIQARSIFGTQDEIEIKLLLKNAECSHALILPDRTLMKSSDYSNEALVVFLMAANSYSGQVKPHELTFSPEVERVFGGARKMARVIGDTHLKITKFNELNNHMSPSGRFTCWIIPADEPLHHWISRVAL